jgi:3-oxoacyl-[acyl-carrier protein] reductase
LEALDQAAVETYVNRVVETVGGIDAVFNAIGLPPAELGYPAPSTTQDLEMFLEPARVIVGSTFVTARAAAVPMMRQGHGPIVTLSATLSGIAAPYMAGISAACGAIEAMTRSLAGEFGPAGVRVNCVRGSAMSETRTIRETSAGQARLQGIEPDEMQLPSTALGHPITVAEVAGHRRFPRLRRVERDDRPGRHRRRRRRGLTRPSWRTRGRAGRVNP